MTDLKPYYADDWATIYHGDCRTILPSLGRFDLCLTDPPYGIGADNQKRILSRGVLASSRDYGAGVAITLTSRRRRAGLCGTN
jgi:DNA modification methylase